MCILRERPFELEALLSFTSLCGLVARSGRTGTGWASPWQWWRFLQSRCRLARTGSGRRRPGRRSVSGWHCPFCPLGPRNTALCAETWGAQKCSELLHAWLHNPCGTLGWRSTEGKNRKDRDIVLFIYSWPTVQVLLKFQKWFGHSQSRTGWHELVYVYSTVTTTSLLLYCSKGPACTKTFYSISFPNLHSKMSKKTYLSS